MTGTLNELAHRALMHQAREAVVASTSDKAEHVVIRSGHYDDWDTVQAAVHAIMAERDRCARAAFDEEKTYGTSMGNLQYLSGYMKGRQDAASAIRDGES